MDTAIAALILALIGFGLALFAIIVATRRALHPPKKRPPIADGLYRMRQIGKDGPDTIFEIEEISKEETNNEVKETVPEPGSEEAAHRRKAP